MSDKLVKRMNAARDFPINTCPASRHAAMIAESLCLCKGERQVMLEDEPKHCGESIAATVASLWECRAENARLREALTPSGDTKAKYAGEFHISVYDAEDKDGNEIWRKVPVDWTTIKAIMGAIRDRAAIQETDK